MTVQPETTTSLPSVEIHLMAGSQYSAKVIAALDWRGVPHTVKYVSAIRSKRKLPSGGSLVPEAVFGGDEIVPDSDAILEKVDEYFGTGYFPNLAVIELNKRLSTGVVPGAVVYYNWVYPPTHAETIRLRGIRSLSPALCCLRGVLVDSVTKEAKKDYRIKAAKQLGVTDAELEDEPAIRRALTAELISVQTTFTGPGDYLLGFMEPTAADFTLYAMMERFCGDMGDGDFPPSLPDLLDTRRELSRLAAWHKTMRAHTPLVFSGKRGDK